MTEERVHELDAEALDLFVKKGSAGGPGVPLRARPRSVAFICMPETGHFQRLRSLIAGMTRSGIAAHVFTHRKFAPQVERAGGVFFDLFSKYPLEQADDMSFPIPCRYVSFAAKYADPVRIEVEKTGASLLIHDTFAVVGRVVAGLLSIPRVNVCSGRNVAPARFLEILREDPRVRLSPECLRAVEVQEADAFVTHQRMNSTHEAIFHRVPMISYPFFWDQPALAKKCHQFGLSIPLADSQRGAFSEDDIRSALARLAYERESMRAALSRAHEWERAVIDNRSVVLQQIADLMG
jgi:UDP:flavonoid glycosyltransferase YjiC (YdhE family)